MTDRIKGLTVSFTHDIRKDDCEAIINAIQMIKGVAAVKANVTDSGDWMARQHVKSELRDLIFEWFRKL